MQHIDGIPFFARLVPDALLVGVAATHGWMAAVDILDAAQRRVASVWREPDGGLVFPFDPNEAPTDGVGQPAQLGGFRCTPVSLPAIATRHALISKVLQTGWGIRRGADPACAGGPSSFRQWCSGGSPDPLRAMILWEARRKPHCLSDVLGAGLGVRYGRSSERLQVTVQPFSDHGGSSGRNAPPYISRQPLGMAAHVHIMMD